MSEQQRAYWAGLVKPSRLRLGLTQTELAESSGVSRRTVGNVEAGRVVPHMGILERLDSVLGFLPDDDPADYPLEIRTWISAICPLLMRMDVGVRGRVMQHCVAYAGHALADARMADDLHAAASAVSAETDS